MKRVRALFNSDHDDLIYICIAQIFTLKKYFSPTVSAWNFCRIWLIGTVSHLFHCVMEGIFNICISIFLRLLSWCIYVVRTIYSFYSTILLYVFFILYCTTLQVRICVQPQYNCIVQIIYTILYYVLVPICVKSICIIFLL